MAEERLIVALGTTEVEIFSEDGTSVCNHKRVYMDSLDKDSLKTELRLMRDEAARTGWASMIQAVELSYATTHRIDGASIAVSASHIASSNDVIAYDEPVDLCVYDSVFSGKEA